MFKFLIRVAIIFVLLLSSISAQSDDNFISILIPKELSDNANAVVRYEKLLIDVKAYNKMYVTTLLVVTYILL